MNADQAAAIVALLTGTIEQEGGATRKVLAAVPSGNRDFKPDPKSRSAWELAVHLAISDVWFADSILQGKFEWSGEPPTPPASSAPPVRGAGRPRRGREVAPDAPRRSPRQAARHVVGAHAEERRVLRHE